MLACSFFATAQAQRPLVRHAQVGAGDIFAALTQPDRAAELEALHALSEALSGTPDPAKLDAARTKLAEVLQAAERHQADMPPALVMSGIASRIEAAMAGLEEARHAPPPAPDRLQTLLVPGLAAVSAALGVALIACLAGLAARGRQAEAQEELQDTLKKIRRRLEGGAPAAVTAGVAQEIASGEASEAVHQATVAVDRLGSAARDAEGRLQSAVSDAEARLHAAATMAGQLEHWMESLPDRMAASVQAMEARGLPEIEATAARIEESAASLAGLQDLLADYGSAVSGLTAQAELATANLHGEVSSLQERFDVLAGALPERIAGALPAALGELTSAADLLAELSHLAIGQTERVEDIVARAEKVACDLPAVAQSLEAASAHLLGQLDQDAISSAAARQAADDLAEMSQLGKAAAESLGGRLAAAADAMEARLARGAERFQAHMEAVGETVGTRFAGRTELMHAGLEQAALAVANAAATLPDMRDGLREAMAGLAREAAALLESVRACASDERASGLAQTLLLTTAQLETALGAAEAMRMQAAEQAEAVQARQTEQVTTLFEILAGRAEACLGTLRGVAAELAASAMRMNADAGASDQIQAQAGALLSALQSVCQRLEETLAAFGETGAALKEGVERIGQETQRMQDGSASAQAVLTERMAAVLDRDEQVAAQPALIGLQAATEAVQLAAARLLESAQAQDAALACAAQAAAEVARLTAAPKPHMPEAHALAGLTGIASLAESLQGEAENLAACVLRGDAVRIPAELISQTPVMLAAIETSIHRLRGTATALALASDGRLKAA